jgi:hypothetical protein
MKKSKKLQVEKAVEKMLDIRYNPGSDKAIERGCQCPIIDNGHGRGYMGQEGVFVFNMDCPMHGWEGKELLK